jgi:predicted AlkP superfamily pyrophosphatase or phosphodiesterase
MRVLLLTIAALLTLTNTQAQKTKKAVFVIVDGIAADVIETQQTPYLDKIAKQGGYARAYVGGEKDGYSQTPTISAVGYNSLLTGTWVNKHNVWDNDIAAPNYNYWTIFRFFKTQYPDKKTAIFSSWLDNRTKLAGDGMEETGKLKIDYQVDGLELDTVRFPHDKQKAYMHQIDEEVVQKASESIREQAPDLSWVYLEYTDDMGHMYGDSEAFYKAVGYMDQQMGKLWEAIEYRQKKFNEEWVIYITTDHGRDAKTGKHHGGQSDRERSTWIVTSAKGLNTYFKSGKAGVVDIMPSIARFLDIKIPREQAMEIDGISITGPLSATNFTAKEEGGKIYLSWKPESKKGAAKIWVTTTNNFKTGGNDQYTLIKTVPVADGKAVIDMPAEPSAIYKIVLETPHHFMNRWIVK